MKKIRTKIKTKASKEQFIKFKDYFEKNCDNPNKDKLHKTIKNAS